MPDNSTSKSDTSALSCVRQRHRQPWGRAVEQVAQPGFERLLAWTPIEYTEAALAMFSRHMASMTGGWGAGGPWPPAPWPRWGGGGGASFDKLDEWLAEEGVDPSCSA
jgi:hypothetical protein